MYSLRGFASYQWRSVLANARGSGNYDGLLYWRSDATTPTIHGSAFARKNACLLIDDRRVHNGSNVKMEKCISRAKRVEPEVQSSRNPFFPSWAKWSLGAILSLLTYGKEKWECFLRLEGKVEDVAEVVEKVASVAEKVSSEVADVLPEDSKLKDAARLVEYVSKEAEKDAHLILKLIHKVDKLKQEAVERVFEPIRKHEKLLDEESGEK
ncbi:hypothetical protein RHSIM_Rhsim06G0077000 [Rhododendron simsii]|uniref:Uncharacterized protein n=1 Tax=Rhododendron simsii TaxID=118357 RepID=A0A834GZK3_RHOSS|nr:hypothetical protein RHSIM_Rhsim06G0077000 [Rhododendron simsii]